MTETEINPEPDIHRWHERISQAVILETRSIFKKIIVEGKHSKLLYNLTFRATNNFNTSPDKPIRCDWLVHAQEKIVWEFGEE